MENNNKENKNLTALPVWMPNACPKFNDNMQANAPFIVTREMTRTDLGLSIIGTRYPRVVARYVSFPTQRGLLVYRKMVLQRRHKLQRKADGLILMVVPWLLRMDVRLQSGV